MSLVHKGFLFLLRSHLYLMVLVVPLFFAIPGIYTTGVGNEYKNLAISLISASLITIYIIYLFFCTPPPTIRLSLTNVSILFFLLMVVVASLFSGSITYSLKKSLIQILLVVVFFLTQGIANSARIVTRVQVMAIISAFLVALYGACQYIGWDFLYQALPVVINLPEGRAHIFSTIGNPEYLGSYIAAISVQLVPGIVAGSLRKAVYWIRLICFLFFLLIIMLTGARGAFIGLFIASVFIVFICLKTGQLRLRKVHYFSFGTIIISLVVIAIIFSFPNPINVRNLNVLGRFKHLVNIRDDSIKERILFYGVCAEMITDHPIIGIGSGMFAVKFYPYIREMVERDPRAGMMMTLGDLKNRVPENAHNDFLQFWVEYGSLGFFAFLLAIIAHFSATYTRLLNAGSSRHSLLEMSLMGAVLCLIVNAAFSFPLHTPTRATLFWILFGLSHKMSGVNLTGCNYGEEESKVAG